MKCACGKPAIILIQAKASGKTMWLCKEHCEIAVSVPGLSRSTVEVLRGALVRNVS